jgi:hypothetical protein
VISVAQVSAVPWELPTPVWLGQSKLQEPDGGQLRALRRQAADIAFATFGEDSQVGRRPTGWEGSFEDLLATAEQPLDDNALAESW